MADDHWLTQYGSIPRLLENQDVFVIGGGPSLRNFEPSRLEGKKVIVTNEAFQLFPDALALVFVDQHWWQARQGAVREKPFTGLVVGRGPYLDAYRRSDCLAVAYRSGEFWSQDARVLGGRNSGLAAANAAWLMGAKRIFLLGFDMASDQGRNNFHNLYADSPRGPAHRYVSIFLPEFASAAKRLETIGGGVVINCTPGSAMTCFPERTIEWAIENTR